MTPVSAAPALPRTVPTTPNEPTPALIEISGPVSESALVMLPTHALAASPLPTPKEAVSPAEDVLETRLQIQRAQTEQVRRVSECLRLFYETLLQHLAQPAFQMDRDGIVVRWNAPMVHWSGIASEKAAGQPLATLLSALLSEPLLQAFAQIQTAIAEGGDAIPIQSGVLLPEGLLAATPFHLIPLCRVPGCIEAVVCLLEPHS